MRRADPIGLGIIAGSTFLFMSLVGCPSPGEEEAPPPPVVDQRDLVILAQEENLNTFNTALASANMIEMLRQPGPYTVFAPNDEAFAQLPSGTLDTLFAPQNRDRLRHLMMHLIIEGEHGIGDPGTAPRNGATVVPPGEPQAVPPGSPPAAPQPEPDQTATAPPVSPPPAGWGADTTRAIRTLHGDSLRISIVGGQITVDDVRVIRSAAATNGMLHIIDRVLMPADLLLRDDPAPEAGAPPVQPSPAQPPGN